MNNASVNS